MLSAPEQTKKVIAGTTAAPAGESRRPIYLAALLIILAGYAAYAESFSAPFIFDDTLSIVGNPSIHQLWRLAEVLSPSDIGTTVTARPVLNLSLALNYAVSGLDVWSYHAGNLVIHLLAGLTLFGLVRRTLLQPVLRVRYGVVATPLACFVALLWVVHPLQTESVTYLSQRAESLMGLFYLFTLYAFVRGEASTTPGRWQAAAVAACLLGMGTKEVMVTVPLMVFLYDRTFIAGNFREAWRRHRRFYAALAATELLLVWLVIASGGDRGQSASVGLSQSAWLYALTQGRAILLYLKLAVWPQPLVFDYGTTLDPGGWASVPYVMVVTLLLLATILALWRRPVPGFLGAWFFLILAPSSSVVPIVTQTMAEHRMYLPLAAVLVLVVTFLYRFAGCRSWPILGALVLGLGVLTFMRNLDYADAVGFWTGTVAQEPANARAHRELGNALLQVQLVPEAAKQFEEAVRLDPNSPQAQMDLASTLYALGRTTEAIEHYRVGQKLSPQTSVVYFDLANALAKMNQPAAAEQEYRIALALDPASVETRMNLGNLLTDEGRLPEALVLFEQATWLDLDNPATHYNLANTLLRLRRFAEAKTRYAEAIRLAPGNTLAHAGLANALLMLGEPDKAIPEYEEALRLQPNLEIARANLAVARQIVQAGAATGPNAGH